MRGGVLTGRVVVVGPRPGIGNCPVCRHRLEDHDVVTAWERSASMTPGRRRICVATFGCACDAPVPAATWKNWLFAQKYATWLARNPAVISWDASPDWMLTTSFRFLEWLAVDLCRWGGEELQMPSPPTSVTGEARVWQGAVRSSRAAPFPRRKQSGGLLTFNLRDP